MQAHPPEPTLRWLVGVLHAFEVTGIQQMRGSSTSALHRVTLRLRSGVTRSVVVRRYVLKKVLADEPNSVGHEASALRIAASVDVPTPELLAVDPDGSRSDAPTVVMSLLDGRPRWEAGSRGRFVADIADAMVTLGDAVVPPGLTVETIKRYDQSSYAPPRWSTQPGVWDRAVEIFHHPIPAVDNRFVHRDFHPGNLLWSRGHISGIVDWQAACLGPSSIDPGHCRLNMFYYDPALADELRTAWERRSGHAFDPWADVMSIIGVLDSLRNTKKPSKSSLAIEDALAQAVAQLTG